MEYDTFSDERTSDPCAAIYERAEASRERQRERFERSGRLGAELQWMVSHSRSDSSTQLSGAHTRGGFAPLVLFDLRRVLRRMDGELRCYLVVVGPVDARVDRSG